MLPILCCLSSLSPSLPPWLSSFLCRDLLSVYILVKSRHVFRAAAAGVTHGWFKHKNDSIVSVLMLIMNMLSAPLLMALLVVAQLHSGFVLIFIIPFIVC